MFKLSDFVVLLMTLNQQSEVFPGDILTEISLQFNYICAFKDASTDSNQIIADVLVTELLNMLHRGH